MTNQKEVYETKVICQNAYKNKRKKRKQIKMYYNQKGIQIRIKKWNYCNQSHNDGNVAIISWMNPDSRSSQDNRSN